LHALELEEKVLESAREAPIHEDDAPAFSGGTGGGGPDREDDFSHGR
jgi:hypothetical protein